MENEKVQIDEKTAKMIEEMDKSLKNMEQSLGMDHPVIAKLLDSYATLLRQNKIRPVDALNMEARAKAIRAKNNQKEAQKQSEALSESVAQEKHMSASQLRLISQCVAGVIACGFLMGGYQMYKWFDTQKLKKSSKVNIIRGNRFVESRPRNMADALSANTQLETPPDQTSTSTEQNPSAPDNLGRQPASTQNTPENSQNNNADLAAKTQELKNFAKDKLAQGQAAENEKDFPKASALYFEVVQMAQNTNNTLGKPLFTEEIARCYEGYGRMAELDAHPDIAKQCEQTAAEVRSHLND